jgi:hypothetical protein
LVKRDIAKLVGCQIEGILASLCVIFRVLISDQSLLCYLYESREYTTGREGPAIEQGSGGHAYRVYSC